MECVSYPCSSAAITTNHRLYCCMLRADPRCVLHWLRELLFRSFGRTSLFAYSATRVRSFAIATIGDSFRIYHCRQSVASSLCVLPGSASGISIMAVRPPPWSSLQQTLSCHSSKILRFLSSFRLDDGQGGHDQILATAR